MQQRQVAMGEAFFVVRFYIEAAQNGTGRMDTRHEYNW